ncbi:hypothetical protein CK203_050599 [Vitis vinifera]|uniref:Uncharacterized protein n=1 Tax=Vitis vinifera TaxID=29760 RepID=A0A438GFG2_VITVI|nr:hypothetical protein CK203_050599 [Vitis vinifera]
MGSVSAPASKMSANKKATSSSSSEQSDKDASGDVHMEKSVDKLNVREFRERFYIPNGVSVQLVDGEAVSTEKSEDNSIFFTNEQFNAGLQFPLPSLFKEFLHFTQIPPAYIHPNIVRVLMGCSILSILFNLDLSLLEVLFIYSIKKGKNDIFSFVASLPSFQLMTSLSDSTKGAARGHVMVKGLWAGLTVHPDRQFAPNQSLKAPSKDKRGKLVKWVEKASFERLNRLFEIAADERSCETLLSAQNLRSVTQEPQPYVLNILLRRLPKKVVAGEHFVLKDLPFYTEVRKANAQARKIRLNEQDEKRQEATLRKAPGDKRPAPSPPIGAPAKKKKKNASSLRLPSVSSGSAHIVCLNGLGPSMPAARRLAFLVEEATSVNQPRSPHPDADVAGALVLERCLLRRLQWKKRELKVRSAAHPSGRIIRRVVRRRWQKRTQPSWCWSRMRVHSKRPSRPWNDGGPDLEEESHPTTSLKGSPVDDAAYTSASPFNYAELGEMLKRITSGSDVAAPSAKMFEAPEMLVSGIALGLEQAEASLSAARRAFEESAEALKKSQEDNEALRIELAKAKSREESIDARLHEAEGEMAQLRGKVRQLRTEVSIEKKQREDLQSRLSAQKEELEAEFAAQMEELQSGLPEAGRRNLLLRLPLLHKKHGIKRDVPSIPPVKRTSCAASLPNESFSFCNFYCDSSLYL